MLVLFYYNWNGTVKEMYEWEEQVKKTYEDNKDVKLKGMYTPSIPWNRVWLFKTDSIDALFSSWGERSDNIRNTDLVILT